MKSPNVWIGVGPYGNAFLTRAASRLELLDLVGSIDATARPILCHLRTNDDEAYPLHPEIYYLDGRLCDDDGLSQVKTFIEEKLHPGIRQGNTRGTGYFFVVSHADDIAEGQIDSDHWLWNLPEEVNFDVGYISIVVAAERPAEEVGGVWRDQIAAKLRAVTSAMRSATQQLIVLKPTGTKASFDQPDVECPSVDSAVIFFELLCSIQRDPMRVSSLAALLQRRQTIEPEPTCASFEIRARGINFGEAVTRARSSVRTAVLRSMRGRLGDGGAANPANDRPLRLPDLDVPAPPRPDRLDKLDFHFRPSIWAGPNESLRGLDNAEASLTVDVLTLWNEHLTPNLSHTKRSREVAGERLDLALRWFNELVLTIWERGIPARALADTLSNLSQSFVSEHRDAEQGSEMSSPDPPKIAPLVDRLRAALLSRPRASTTLLLLGLLLVTSMFVGFAATEWLSKEFSRLDVLGRAPIQLLAALIAGGLATFEPLRRWYLRPRREVDLALQRVRRAIVRARDEVERLRTAYSRHVRAVIRGDLANRLVTEANLAERRFRELHGICLTLDDWTAPADSSVVSNRRLENLSASPGQRILPSDEELAKNFRSSHIPTSLSWVDRGSGDGQHEIPKEFNPDQFQVVVNNFFKERILDVLMRTPLIEPARVVQPDDLKIEPILGKIPGMITGFVNSESQSSLPFSEQAHLATSTEMILGRTDKFYILCVVNDVDINAALR